MGRRIYCGFDSFLTEARFPLKAQRFPRSSLRRLAKWKHFSTPRDFSTSRDPEWQHTKQTWVSPFRFTLLRRRQTELSEYLICETNLQIWSCMAFPGGLISSAVLRKANVLSGTRVGNEPGEISFVSSIIYVQKKNPSVYTADRRIKARLETIKYSHRWNALRSGHFSSNFSSQTIFNIKSAFVLLHTIRKMEAEATERHSRIWMGWSLPVLTRFLIMLLMSIQVLYVTSLESCHSLYSAIPLLIFGIYCVALTIQDGYPQL